MVKKDERERLDLYAPFIAIKIKANENIDENLRN